MIILDGFSSNYMQRDLCPNLYDLSKANYFSKLEPMFGFQGVGAAIYSGASPNTTGVFTEFILQKNEFVAESQLLRAFLRFTDKVPNDRLCANARNILFRILGKRHGISNVIPSQLLAYFSPKLKDEFTTKNILRHVPTIFDILRENDMSYELQRPAPRLENAAINDIIDRLERRKIPDLTVIHPCSIDLIGHKFGPHSSHIKRTVKKVDQQMYRIIRSIGFSSEKILLIILSDHGMSPVTRKYDMLELLDQLSLTGGKDYLVFLDSTMARFWFFNKRARKLIYERLSTLKCGQMLHKSDMKKLGINNIGQEYGELIFALNEGYTIFPDFFRKCNPPKGMHGYAFPVYDSPIMIMYAPIFSGIFKRKRIAKYVDIMPTILEWFDLPIPQTCEGTSLLSHD